MRRGEVLPLEADVRQLLLDGLHELIDEIVVRLTRHALVPPAEVLGVLESFGVVGSDVQHDRQRPLRANAADRRVQGELADRDAQSTRALVADPEDALAVRDDDDVDLGVGTVPEKRRDGIPERVRDEQPARPAIDVAELLARQSHDRRVDHRCHLLDVVEEQPVEEDLVRVLERAQVDVPLEVVGLSRVRFVSARHLLVERFDVRRQEALQSEVASLVLGERRALVHERQIEDFRARGAGASSRRGRVLACFSLLSAHVEDSF